MNFVKKIVSSITGLFRNKTESASQKDTIAKEQNEAIGDSKFKRALKQLSVFVFAYLKRFVLFVLGLINTMMQPMIKISKK